MKKDTKWINDLIGTIQLPIIAHSMGVQSVPKDLRQQIPVIRMIQLMKEPEKFREYATDIEAMILYLLMMIHDGPWRGFLFGFGSMN